MMYDVCVLYDEIPRGRMACMVSKWNEVSWTAEYMFHMFTIALLLNGWMDECFIWPKVLLRTKLL